MGSGDIICFAKDWEMSSSEGNTHVTPGSDQTSFLRINLSPWHPHKPPAREPLLS